MMKKIKGEDIDYTVDRLEGTNAIWIGYILSIAGAGLLIICIFSTIKLYLEIKTVSIDVIAGIGGILVSIVLLCFGLIRIIGKRSMKSHVIYIKQNGKKSQGKIKKGYIDEVIFNNQQDDNFKDDFYYYYYLKVSYFNKDTNKEENFITPRIYGVLSEISSDKVEVYYYNGEAVIDNLVVGGNQISFEEGIFHGNPEIDVYIKSAVKED